MNIFRKIRFDNSFYFFLVLVILCGQFKMFSFIFLLIFFHELGHAITGFLLKWDINSITFYPYGGITKFDVLENRSLKKEIMILIMGSIFQIITYFILSNLFNYSYIKDYHYTLLIFNLLPIYTLDGGRLVNLLCSFVFNYLVSFYITIGVSLITIISLIIYSINYYQNFNFLFMLIFLIFKILEGIKNVKYYYQKFLIERYLYDFKYSKTELSKSVYNMYKEKYHYINNQDEKKYLKKYFEKYEKT